MKVQVMEFAPHGSPIVVAIVESRFTVKGAAVQTDDNGKFKQAFAQPTLQAIEQAARACMDGSRYEQALPLLEEIHHHTPGRTDWAQLLARCQLRLGLLDEAAATASATLTTFDETQAAAAHLIQQSILTPPK